MKLGIFVNTDRHLTDIIGFVKAARAAGHDVILFNMDDGTKLLDTPEFRGLCTMEGVSMSFCDYSAKNMGIASEGIPPEIVCGSQYNNVAMVHDADRVIVL
ncbi:MAG TPA: DsrE family protein [Thermodesulfovibrionales bacterium]|nr:DsrE family protein [Thermodesulfovibrionales bacterium]